MCFPTVPSWPADQRDPRLREDETACKIPPRHVPAVAGPVVSLRHASIAGGSQGFLSKMPMASDSSILLKLPFSKQPPFRHHFASTFGLEISGCCFRKWDNWQARCIPATLPYNWRSDLNRMSK